MAFDEAGDQLELPRDLDDPAVDDVSLVGPLVELEALQKSPVSLLVVLVLVDLNVGAGLEKFWP